MVSSIVVFKILSTSPSGGFGNDGSVSMQSSLSSLVIRLSKVAAKSVLAVSRPFKLKSFMTVAGMEAVSNSEYSFGFCSSVGLLTKVPFLIHGDMAIVGIRTPSLLNVNPFLALNLSGDGMCSDGGATWS